MPPRLLLLAALLAAPTLQAAALPDAVPYQGRIAASGTAFTGTGHFKFAVYQQSPGNPASAALLWTSAAGAATGSLAEPATAITLPVTNGLFALGLGDTAVAGMAMLPPSLAPADGQRAFVRVWFSATGTAGSFQTLSPDTELRSVPFAREAGSVAGITAANIPQLTAATTFNNVSGLTVTGTAPVGNAIADGTTVPVSGPGSRMEFIPGLAAFRAGSVDGSQWDNGNIGLYSTALGFNTSAPALRSTALGNGATANGIGSLSIGSGTTANGWNSMALGFNSTTDGYAASTLGRGLAAASEAELALGSYNTFYSPSSWYGWSPTDRLLVVGNGSSNSARSDALVMLKNGDTTLNGNLTINGTITAANLSGSGSTANVASLDAANTFTNVSGLTIQGNGPTLEYVLSEDRYVSVAAAGTRVPVSGPGCRMEFIPGLSAFRAGYVNLDQWDASNIGFYSTAMGTDITASGDCSTAMGCGTKASGYSSTAMGAVTTASGRSSTAMGSGTKASGDQSTAMGERTTASGRSSTAMGAVTTASGNDSTAMGFSTTASGLHSTAMGSFTIASNYSSTAMGNYTTASGERSTAMGEYTTASGWSSTAMGEYTTASGWFSTAMGENTTAPSYAETALGCYNTIYTPNSATGWSAGDRLLVVGNGTSDTAHSDAFIINKRGDAWLAGTLLQASDRNRKTEIVAVDTAAVLAGVASLPIATWRFKEDTATHLGPMAQDFAAAFRLGNTDKGIATVDADGVALAAIQELKKQLDAKEARLTAVEAQNAVLLEDSATKEARLAAVENQNAAKDAKIVSLEARLAALEAKLAQ